MIHKLLVWICPLEDTLQESAHPNDFVCESVALALIL